MTFFTRSPEQREEDDLKVIADLLRQILAVLTEQ